jgi:hypothetical protein
MIEAEIKSLDAQKTKLKKALTADPICHRESL